MTKERRDILLRSLHASIREVDAQLLRLRIERRNLTDATRRAQQWQE